MTDVLTKDQRRRNMQAIRCEDTKPEITVRRILHEMKVGYRLHVHNLPGNPDIVLRRGKNVIFVNGCFWHHHEGCRYAVRPSTNTDFWDNKLKRTQERDVEVRTKLETAGYTVFTIWECETRDITVLMEKINAILTKTGAQRRNLQNGR